MKYVATKSFKLPAEYQEVEYIESTGTQYINLGIRLTNRHSYEIGFQSLDNDNSTGNYGTPIFGARDTTTRNAYALQFNQEGYLRFGWKDETTTIESTIIDLERFHTISVESGGRVKYDGVQVYNRNDYTTFSTPATASAILFGIGTSGSIGIYHPDDLRISYFKLWRDDALVYDMVPCYRKSNNKKGMYDLVNNQFYTNSGSGDDFIVGPNVCSTELTQLKKHYIAVGSGEGGRLPAEYQEVEYLESDGSQYINTEVIPTTETKAEFTAQVLSHRAGAFEGVFGSRTANNTNAFCFGISTGNVFFSQFDNATRTGAFNNYDLNKHSYVMSKDGLYQDENLVTTYTDIKTISSTKSIFIMGTNSEDSVGVVSTSQRSYGAKIYESNVINREMIPCYRKSDNKAGMYDLRNTGKNLVGIFEYAGNTLSASDGQLSANASYSTTEYVAVKPNTTYTWRRYSSFAGTIARLCEYRADKTYTNKNTLINITTAGAGQVTFTTGSTTAYIRLSKRNTDTQIQLEEGSVATTYEPYPFYVNAGTGEFELGPDVETDGIKLVELKSMYVAVGKSDESRLPREYREVEYIQSTGTQYIDTGVYGNQDTKLVIKFTRTGADADSSWNGTGSANRNDAIRVATAPSGTTVVGGFGDLSFKGTGEDKYKTPYGQFREVYIDKNEMRYDGVKLLDVNYTGAFTTSTTIWLAGCSNSSYSYKGKVAYAKIYDNDILVRDFIPCYRKSDNVAGMYDIVNNVFYTNAGKGSFIKGPIKNLPSEYQEVEYLESTGEQYIDTLQNVTTNTKIELVFQSDKQIGDAFINLFGSRNSGTVTAGLFALIGTNNDIQVSSGGTSYRLNTPNLVTTAINPNIVYDNSKSTLIMDNVNKAVSYNGTAIPYGSYLRPTNYAYSMWLFGRRVQGDSVANCFKGKIYSFKVSESGVLVRDFIPCYRKSDNVAGMYDLINNQFFTNPQGTGEFIKGANVGQATLKLVKIV